MTWSNDDTKLTYPEADRLVLEYIHAKTGQRQRTTSVTVLEASDYPNDQHNRNRVRSVLDRFCERVSDSTNWRGRTVFELPRPEDLR